MKTLFTLGLAAGLLVFAGQAWAVPPQVQKTITEAVQKLAPRSEIQSIEASPVPGLYVVVTSGQVVYVSGDGNYMLQGSLYDVGERTDLTALRMNKIRKAALAEVSSDQEITYAPEDPKYHVTVFTDIDCGYCRMLHKHMAQINQEGITVDYLFYPRTGIGSASYDKAVSVWCADEQQKAMDLAKAGEAPEPAKCSNPVAEDFELGQRLGVTGTPTIIADDGSVIGGYLTPQQLLLRVKAVAAKMQSGAAGEQPAKG